MTSKINKIKYDLRALKKSSHAIQRLVELQGLHYKRIDALSRESNEKSSASLIEKEKQIINSLRVEEHIAENEALYSKYMEAISTLCPQDKAMVLDCYVNGMPYWKLGLEYGYAEEGARKHMEAIIKHLAQII